MTKAIEIMLNVFPIILYCSLGMLCRRMKIVNDNAINQLKAMIMKVLFPCFLFTLFLFMKLEVRHIWVLLLMLLILTLDYLFGVLVNRLPFLRIKVLPLFTTAFCYAFLGIPLFTLMHGAENLKDFILLGIAHEAFVWIIYYVLVNMTYSKQRFSMDSVKHVVQSPTMVAIFFSVLLNLLGVGKWLESQWIFYSILQDFAKVGDIVSPLILICIGYSMTLKKEYMPLAVKLIIVRLVITLGVAYAVKPLYNLLVPATMITDASYFTWAILPPIFSMPIMAGSAMDPQEASKVNTATMLYTIVSLVLFIIYHVVVAVM